MKKTFIQITLSFSIGLLLLACSNAEPKIDKDTKNAEKVVDQLHDLMKQHKYNETHALFSDKFKEVNTWESIHVVYDSTANLGAIKKKQVTTAEATAGPEGSTLYNLIVEVTRTKINSTEQYHMEKKEGEEAKIVSFKILSVPYIE